MSELSKKDVELLYESGLLALLCPVCGIVLFEEGNSGTWCENCGKVEMLLVKIKGDLR